MTDTRRGPSTLASDAEGPPYMRAWSGWFARMSTASSMRASGLGAFFAAGTALAEGRGMSSSRSGSADDPGLPDGGAPDDMRTIIPQGPVLLATREMPSSKRLEFLLKMTASSQADPFAWYGL